MQVEKIISTTKRPFLNAALAISLAFGASVKASDYTVSQVIDGSSIEHRLYYKQHHFMTIIDDSGTFNIRPHPGLDRNGWGSSWYMQPFLPSAILKHTTIESIVPDDSSIDVAASGFVSRGSNDTYGTWNTNLSFGYDPENKVVSGSGNYVINLSGNLSSSTGDLNLYKIASSYLLNVPLLTGGSGDTGDMNQADVIGKFNFTWNPPENPSYFPQDITDYLSIDVIGQFNIVDSAAQGYQPIKPAYKPSMKVALSNSDPNHQGIDMIFGAVYDTSQSQYYWADNVGITPLILNRSSLVHYSFDVAFESGALPGDTYDNLDVAKCTVKARRTQGQDTFDASGTFEESLDLNDITQIVVNIVSLDDDYLVHQESVDFDASDVVKGKFKYKGRAGAITSLKIDFTRKTFKMKAKNIDLTGLGCPLQLNFILGSYMLSGDADEDVVNSAKEIPIRLMRTYKDEMRVKNAKAKNKIKVLADTFTVKGEIAVEDVSVNLANEEVIITWGDQTFIMLAGSFTAKSGNSYKCSKIPSTGDSGLVTAKIDLDKCTFSISVKNADLDVTSGTVDFGISFGDFDETAEISLP